jgi:hypothetical protein
MAGGIQVDAWGALVPDRAELIDDVKKDLVKEVEERGIENLKITTVDLGIGSSAEALIGEKREHLLFEQKLGGGAVASVAMRIAPRGKNDMEISWRLMENNAAKAIVSSTTQWGLVIFGAAWSLLSLALMPLGIGFCTFIIGPIIMGWGLGWWGVEKGKTRATTYQQLDSRALVQAIDYSLMKTLENHGVSKDELRVLLAAQTEGIGKLGRVPA